MKKNIFVAFMSLVLFLSSSVNSVFGKSILEKLESGEIPKESVVWGKAQIVSSSDLTLYLPEKGQRVLKGKFTSRIPNLVLPKLFTFQLRDKNEGVIWTKDIEWNDAFYKNIKSKKEMQYDFSFDLDSERPASGVYFLSVVLRGSENKIISERSREIEFTQKAAIDENAGRMEKSFVSIQNLDINFSPKTNRYKGSLVLDNKDKLLSANVLISVGLDEKDILFSQTILPKEVSAKTIFEFEFEKPKVPGLYTVFAQAKGPNGENISGEIQKRIIPHEAFAQVSYVDFFPRAAFAKGTTMNLKFGGFTSQNSPLNIEIKIYNGATKEQQDLYFEAIKTVSPDRYKDFLLELPVQIKEGPLEQFSAEISIKDKTGKLIGKKFFVSPDFSPNGILEKSQKFLQETFDTHIDKSKILIGFLIFIGIVLAIIIGIVIKVRSKKRSDIQIRSLVLILFGVALSSFLTTTSFASSGCDLSGLTQSGGNTLNLCQFFEPNAFSYQAGFDSIPLEGIATENSKGIFEDSSATALNGSFILCKKPSTNNLKVRSGFTLSPDCSEHSFIINKDTARGEALFSSEIDDIKKESIKEGSYVVAGIIFEKSGKAYWYEFNVDASGEMNPIADSPVEVDTTAPKLLVQKDAAGKELPLFSYKIKSKAKDGIFSVDMMDPQNFQYSHQEDTNNDGILETEIITSFSEIVSKVNSGIISVDIFNNFFTNDELEIQIFCDDATGCYSPGNSDNIFDPIFSSAAKTEKQAFEKYDIRGNFCDDGEICVTGKNAFSVCDIVGNCIENGNNLVIRNYDDAAPKNGRISIAPWNRSDNWEKDASGDWIRSGGTDPADSEFGTVFEANETFKLKVENITEDSAPVATLATNTCGGDFFFSNQKCELKKTVCALNNRARGVLDNTIQNGACSIECSEGFIATDVNGNAAATATGPIEYCKPSCEYQFPFCFNFYVE